MVGQDFAFLDFIGLYWTILDGLPSQFAFPVGGCLPSFKVQILKFPVLPSCFALKKVKTMKYPKVSVVFDRKKRFAKTGNGRLEVVVELGRKTNKYITVADATPETWEAVAGGETVMKKVKECEKILDWMCTIDEDLTVENFNTYYKRLEVKESIMEKPKNTFNGFDQSMDFVQYMKKSVSVESLAPGTLRNKMVLISAVEEFGKLKTLADLTPANIMLFDHWLRQDGTRSDITIYGNYHKKLRKFIRQLVMAEMIPRDPYSNLKIPKGRSKERKPLTERELLVIRSLKLNRKLERARDLFIFCAYTGLSYIDSQVFDFKTMTEKVDGVYYIDGNRIKTGSEYFTPILKPAMEVLEKYDYKLPKISNQKENDYLHVIEALLNLNKSMTTHVARHSFATMILSHNVPMDNVSKMLGHRRITTTQLYAKVLKSTIEHNTKKLQDEIN